MAAHLYSSAPTTVLLFGPIDPTGATHLIADSITCARLGCHALSVTTALHIQDTFATESIQLIDAEFIHDQARCLFEDMNINAIKAGPIYTADCASALTQLAADYIDLPLVLHLTALPDEQAFDDEIELDNTVDALFRLVLPQSNLVVTNHTLLEQWQHLGYLPEDDNPVQSLLAFGTNAVLCLTPAQGSRPAHYALHTQEADNPTTWPLGPTPSRLQDTDNTLSCAITTFLAKGFALDDAIREAISYTEARAQHTLQVGMGALILDQTL